MIFKYFLHRFVYLCLITVVGIETLDGNLKGFDDSILFKINWPGKDGITNEIFDLPEFEHMTVTTENDEQYKCYIPQLTEKEKDNHEKYSGPNPLDLLAPLFAQNSCSIRVEAYWSYELCHGHFIRQFHEDREGKKAKLQEYYLGRWDKVQQEKLKKQIENEEKTRVSDHVPIKKIDGLNMPYIQLNMSDGTMCDLSSKPRLTKVLYVCYAHGKHEIYSLKETSICEYEVIVLSPLLCDHPRYRPQESGERVINCQPIGNTPKKPKSLLQLEAESLKLRHQKPNDGSRVRVEIHPIDNGEDLANHVSPPLHFVRDSVGPVDTTSLKNFLSGLECIQGDAGWWNYEFCYGKNVIQYHVEKDGSKTVVNLGNFIKSAHIDWLNANPHKLPKPLSTRKHVSHYYSGGDICDKTGKPRQTEVKLKCVDGTNTGQGAVSLYLIEPKTCQYILVVESQLICHIITKVDKYGLYDNGDEIGFSRADYKNGYKPYKEDERITVVEGKGKEKKKDDLKVNVFLQEGDDLDNHIPDGDE
ncbi:UNVERIFIED_CONTAM: hypothetical protein PYX00_009710 [Menopon gallinae]|uniref:Endoplasmic reticulum lectin 1 n=1 Tax=Menopon gallinae TaxID=328185 RepID=A0AAW2HD41_9NEOP